MSDDLKSFPGPVTLSEDFVKRAMALRDGRPLDAVDLTLLLEAGVEAMEQMARAQGCDCIDCRGQRGERPSPTAMMDFTALKDQLNRLSDAAESGQARYKAVTLSLSESSLVFMAFLGRLYEAEERNGLRLVQPEVDIDRPADMNRAHNYLSQMIVAVLQNHFDAFEAGKHPLLYRLAQFPGGKPSVH